MKLKCSKLFTVYVTSLVVTFFGVVIHAPIMVFLSSRFPDVDIVFKSWKEIVLFAAAIMGVILVIKNHLVQKLAKDRLVQLILAFIFLHILLGLILWQGWLPFAAGMLIDLRFVLFLLLVVIAMRLKPSIKSTLLKVGFIASVIVVVFAVLQVFVLPKNILAHIGYSDTTIQPYLTVDLNPDYVRINSTLRGPNVLGAYLVIIIVCYFVYLIKNWKAINNKKKTTLFALLVFAVVGLWFTYSRSAVAACVLSVVLAGAIIFIKNKKTLLITAGGLLAIGLIGLAVIFAFRDSSFISNVVFHNNDSGSEIDSNEGHKNSLVEGGLQVIQNPLGSGVGSTGSASLYGDNPIIIENQFLFIAHEVGILGLVVFCGILIIIFKRTWRGRDDWLCVAVFASGVGLVAIGFLLPVFVDETVSITWFGLAGLAIQSRKGVSHVKKNQ